MSIPNRALKENGSVLKEHVSSRPQKPGSMPPFSCKAALASVRKHRWQIKCKSTEVSDNVKKKWQEMPKVCHIHLPWYILTAKQGLPFSFTVRESCLVQWPCLTNWAGQAPKDAAAGRGSAGHSINMHFLQEHLFCLKISAVFTAKRICDEVECRIDINF